MDKKILGRDAILRAEDRPVQEVEVPEWDGIVKIRAMDGLTWSRLVKALAGVEDDTVIRAQTCAACLVGEDGERLFEPGNEEDIALLLEKSHDALMRVSNAAIQMSRAGRKDVEAFRENFPETASDASPSG